MQSRNHAIALARRGLPVFRLKRGTKDVFIDGNWDSGGATTDLMQIFDRFSGDEFNIGCWMGNPHVAVDIDAHHGGEEAWAELLAEIGPLPETLEVRTPSGGRHLVFDGGNEKFGQSDLVKGKINIRASGGYILGAGSHVDDGKAFGDYVIIRDAPIAPLPDKLRDRLRMRANREGPGVTVVADLDTDAVLAAAEAYITQRAPTAIPGARGSTAYRVACYLGDLGVSEERALQYVLRWNFTHCHPPLDDATELHLSVKNAYTYRTAHIGRDAPAAGLTPIEALSPFEKLVTWFEQTPLSARQMEARKWIATRRLARGFVTGLIAPGGVGKSLISIQWAAAIATGDGKPVGLDVKEPTKVLLLNNEDPKNELNLRAHAIFKELGFNWGAAHRRIVFRSGYGEPVRFAMKTREGYKMLPDVQYVIDFIRAHGIGVFVVDPLVSTHLGMDESSPTDMDYLMSAYRHIAKETGVAILVVHHARKPEKASADGYAGDINAARGATSIKDAMRLGLTFFNMSEKDAERYGVAPEKRHRYARLDETEKFNLGQRTFEPEWYERVSVELELQGGQKEWMGVLRLVDLTPAVAEDDGAAISAIVGPHIPRNGVLSASAAVDLVVKNGSIPGTKSKLDKAVREAFRTTTRYFDGRPISFKAVGEKGFQLSFGST